VHDPSSVIPGEEHIIMSISRRSLILAVVLALPMWAAVAANADKPLCWELPEDHPNWCPPPDPSSTTTTTTSSPSWTPSDCAELGWGDPLDESLHLAAGITEDCNDIASRSNKTTYSFHFAVTPAGEVLGTPVILAIRNSVGGDWCDGLWTYRDAEGNVLSGGLDNALTPREVGDGYSATLVLDEVLVGTNCTGDDGEVSTADDNPDWVLTLIRGTGRPLRGNEDIVVTWTVSPPAP
jgi:hypothetical protein